MWFFKKKNKENNSTSLLEVASICDAEIKPIESIDDGIFSAKILGDGIVFSPEKTSKVKIYAPFDGTLETVFETKHAYGISNPKGAKVLIHIGIDTVDLQGQGFESFVKQGQKVKQGDLLAQADMSILSKLVEKTDIIMVVLPESELQNMNNITYKSVVKGDIVMSLS